MTIQIKRGNGADRPNPLLNGEFGWDADGRKLWIGNGVVNENLFVAGAAAITDFTVYVCTTALGGGAADADGVAKSSGTATSTSANKLVDAAAAFDATYANKTVYNKTDDTWAKITAVDSATQLSLSANIMVSGETYDTTNAFATIPLGFAAVPGPYSANVTLRVSPGTFSDAVTFIGKIAAGAKTLNTQGSTTGTTTISGTVAISQKITANNITFSGTTINANYGAEVTWSNCPLVNTRLNTKNGSDLTWNNCDGSGTTKLYTYLGSKNLIENSTITIGNNPENILSINSTVTKDYTIYAAETALGGNDAIADGLAITNGTATSTTANKLVDSAANFTSAVLNKTIYNSTDDTWAKVTVVDSATQLSLSVDIMASGEAYIISNAFATVQGAVNAIPGAVNCNITIKVASGVYREQVSIQGKSYSSSYIISVTGTLTKLTSGTATAGSNTTMTTTLNRTLNQDQYKLLRILSGTGATQERIIKSNTAGPNTVYTIERWITNPDATSVFEVDDWATRVTGSDAGADTTAVRSYGFWILMAQQSIVMKWFLINYTTARGIQIKVFSGFVVSSCHVHNSVHGIEYVETSAGLVGSTYSHNNTGSGFLANGNCTVTIYDCHLKSNGTYGIHNTSFNKVSAFRNTIEYNVSHGIYNANLAFCQSFAGLNACTINNNGGWGVYSEIGAAMSAASSMTYSANTLGTYTPTTQIVGGNS